jgi:hypothetical protein
LGRKPHDSLTGTGLLPVLGTTEKAERKTTTSPRPSPTCASVDAYLSKIKHCIDSCLTGGVITALTRKSRLLCTQSLLTLETLLLYDRAATQGHVWRGCIAVLVHIPGGAAAVSFRRAPRCSPSTRAGLAFTLTGPSTVHAGWSYTRARRVQGQGAGVGGWERGRGGCRWKKRQGLHARAGGAHAPARRAAAAGGARDP